MKKINNRKIMIAICILLVVLLVLLITMQVIIKNQKSKQDLQDKVHSYTSVDDFKTIEEVAEYLECDYIKKNKSKDKNYDIDIYMKIKYEPYIDENSNERFYNRLILYSATSLNYQNFRIIDTQKNITIAIICDKDSKTIKNKLINGENNYFAKHDSYIEMKNIESTKETKFDIQSTVLKKVIEGNWKDIQEEFGSKESTFDNYNIYFDEGVEVRTIDNKIFNIIFTQNYKDDIVNNIKTSTSKENIIKILGEPTFSNEQFGLIGYKGQDIYIFYNSKKEISVYRVEKNYDSTKFAQIVDNYLENKDAEALVKNIKDEYVDFDKYENNSQGIVLQYTLKGIQINFKKGTKKGIQIYKNYTGVIYKDANLESIIQSDELPYNIFVNNKDLVSESEVERLDGISNIILNAQLQRSNESKETIQSNKFYTVKSETDDHTYKISFVSINSEEANSQLRESVDYYLWIDDYNFIYSVKNKGIYLYNLKQRKYVEIIKGKNEEFKIIEYKDNILKYDDKSIKL